MYPCMGGWQLTSASYSFVCRTLLPLVYHLRLSGRDVSLHANNLLSAVAAQKEQKR